MAHFASRPAQVAEGMTGHPCRICCSILVSISACHAAAINCNYYYYYYYYDYYDGDCYYILLPDPLTLYEKRKKRVRKPPFSEMHGASRAPGLLGAAEMQGSKSRRPGSGSVKPLGFGIVFYRAACSCMNSFCNRPSTSPGVA